MRYTVLIAYLILALIFISDLMNVIQGPRQAPGFWFGYLTGLAGTLYAYFRTVQYHWEDGS